MKSYLNVTILTPYGKYLTTEADYVSVQTTNGVLGILPKHISLITTLTIGKLVIKRETGNDVYAISGGVLHIKDNGQVIILANAIEHSSEIDLPRAIEAQKRAEQLLIVKDNIDVERAQKSLSRALNRINVAQNK